MQIDVSNEPAYAEIRQIRRGLSAYNIAKVPELLNLPSDEFVVVLRENGKIIGGTVCNFDWGWLYFDNVWIDERQRGRGLGRVIMEASETYAAERGIQSAFLFTTGFQAKPFYESIGYEVFGENPDRPRGYITSHLLKRNLSSKPIDPRISFENPPIDKTIAELDAGLLAHAARYVPIVHEHLAVFLRDDGGEVRGGISGGTFWSWFDLRYFWLDEALRGQSWGKKLLHAAEEEARKRDCIGIACDTTDFQSLDFYLKQGFEVFGKLEGRPPKYLTYLLQKRLA
jgi:GNAT superfamily N-acetyltransferase